MKKPRFETTIRRCGTAFSITTRNKATGKVDEEDLSKYQGMFNPVSGRLTSRGKEVMGAASRILCELHGIRHHQAPAPKKADTGPTPTQRMMLAEASERSERGEGHRPVEFTKQATKVPGKPAELVIMDDIETKPWTHDEMVAVKRKVTDFEATVTKTAPRLPMGA